MQGGNAGGSVSLGALAEVGGSESGRSGAITVLVPAHNEEQLIAATLTSVYGQTRRPDRVIVIADNCTDETADIARRHGADVVETVGNSQKKAGALNQTLSGLLPTLADGHLVLVMDADTQLADEFIEVAVKVLQRRADAGAVGGVFHGDDAPGFVAALQRNEYARYAREIDRRNGRAVVLTGTASLFRVEVLRQVAAARGEQLPGRPGLTYDVDALTEDNEITLAIKTLGWTTLSPGQCTVTTEVMPTWGDLWRQRLRWQRGALENLRHYGLNRVTLPYITRQLLMYLGIVSVMFFLFVTAVAAAAWGVAPPQGLWLAVTGIFLLDRVWTVRCRGWAGIALAAPLVLEFAYDLFQQAIFLRSAIDLLAGRTAEWHHASGAALNAPATSRVDG